MNNNLFSTKCAVCVRVAQKSKKLRKQVPVRRKAAVKTSVQGEVSKVVKLQFGAEWVSG